MWTLPFLILVTAILLSFPLGRYLAWIMDGRYRAPRWLRWFEERLDTGPQDWKQYTVALLLFNTMAFVAGYVILQLQAVLPLNPDNRGTLSPTTVFNTVTSFMTNTNLQHYSGDQHLSHFSQIGFIVWNMFTSAAVGFCVLAAIIRGLRGDSHMGNYYKDMWRVVMYAFIPLSLLMGVLLMADGLPMTFQGQAQVATVEAGAMGTAPDGKPNPQSIVRGPIAAFIPIKHLGTNGGGFFGANSAHPYENLSAWSNFLTCVNILIFPLSLIVMFGVMLNNMRHAMVIYSVMTILFCAMAGWAIYWDTLHGNPGLTSHDKQSYEVVDATAPDGKRTIESPLVAGLPVDQELGNLEGKELRFGTSAGATFATITTAVTCGSVNCMHDSLNPLAGITPLTGMWLNCVYGGKGVGLVNMLVYLIVG
ncbi:MAG: potassium-transporting ATPase subunit KdpA, partial [Planctomycetaceae bacterium]